MAALATMHAAGDGRLVRNRVLLTLVVVALAAVFGLAFLTVAPNRLVSGAGVALADLLHGPRVALMLPALALAAAAFMRPSRAVDTLVAAAAVGLLTGLVWLAGNEAARQSTQLSPIARVAFGGGFWVLVVLSWLAVADALQRLQLPPGRRMGVHAALWLPLLALLGSGTLDQLSLLKEYANRQEVFHAAGWRHLQIVAATLAPSLLIGLPLGVLAARSQAIARPLFALLNVIQTVPSIALFGLLIAPLVWLADVLPGWGIHGIGLLPAVIALTLYSLLPIVHGMASGLRQVPAAAIAAAVGMGMTRVQVFWRIEMPLALPVLLSALRVTTVQVIGLAVVAALIGAGGYGALVFQGLLSSALDLVLLGVLPVVALAIAADAGLAAATLALDRRRR